MVRILLFLLTLVLSQGWEWSRLLQDDKVLSAHAANVLAGGFLLAFVAQQGLLQLKRPTKRDEVRNRAAVVDVFLRQLSVEYYRLLEARIGQNVPIVRINVMMPVVDLLGIRRRLQICYKSCPDGVRYRHEEMDLYWKRKNGVVGWTWSRGVSHIYGASQADAQAVTRSLDAQQRQATAHLASVLSAPILLNGKPIAVLTLDGQEDLDRTLFGSGDIRELVESYAAKLPSQCYRYGVTKR